MRPRHVPVGGGRDFIVVFGRTFRAHPGENDLGSGQLCICILKVVSHGYIIFHGIIFDHN